MKKSFLLVVLFAACAAQTQSLKMIGVRFAANGSTPNTIKFLCSQKYDHVDCVNDAIALRQAMAPYPMQTLGAWSFVLVTADEWKSLVRSQGGDSVSPAFSMLDQRVTLLDASLFSGSATRSKELMQGFGLMGPQLVDLAVTHEMGHGICLEKTSVVRTTMVRTPEWQHSRMQQDSGAEADQSGDKCPGRRRHRLSTIEEVSSRQL